jgi:hypothetical protein
LLKKLVEMVQKIDNTPQLEMFRTPIQHFIKEGHKLVLLTKKINWVQLEDQLSKYYCLDN